MHNAVKIRNQINGERLREMRLLMGLSSTEVCIKTNMNNGQYSRIEAGELKSDKVLPYVEGLFRVWREKHNKGAQARIDYFNSLTD